MRVRGEEITLGNEWVVPHNKLSCKIQKAHINMEFCSTVKGIKYITKYINNGSDMATFSIGVVGRRDEIFKKMIRQDVIFRVMELTGGSIFGNTPTKTQK